MTVKFKNCLCKYPQLPEITMGHIAAIKHGGFRKKWMILILLQTNYEVRINPKLDYDFAGEW